MEVGWVKFTGDYSILKSMGFGFQKLYAANYMQWHKNGIRVWKRGNDITFDEVNLYKLIKLLEIPQGHRFTDSVLSFYKVYDDINTNKYHLVPWDEGLRMYLTFFDTKNWDDSMQNKIPYVGSCAVLLKSLEVIKELQSLGWLEVIEPKE